MLQQITLVLLSLCVVACTADQSDTVEQGELRALTYNVHGLPAAITGDDTLGRMAQIGPLLPPYDIVGLQEDFSDEGHALLSDATDHPFRRWFDDPLDGHVYGSGLTVFSRFSEVSHHHEHYKDCSGTLDGASDCLASKGIQMIRMALAPGVEVDVYNSHLEAGGGADDDAARAGHVAQLKAAMTGLSAGRAIVFLGDTNLHDSDPEDAPLLKDWIETADLRDACEAVDCPEPGRIDRIFVRDGEALKLTVKSWSVEAQFVDKKGVDLSDHNAIAATLAWTAK